MSPWRERVMLQEKVLKGVSGWLMVVVLVAVAAGVVAFLVNGAEVLETPWMLVAALFTLALDAACWAGLTVVNPNTAKGVLLFGSYHGTIKAPGFWLVNPLSVR